MFRNRSTQLERIDTGDYTPDEYDLFLREIAFINKYLGDERALKRSLFREIEKAIDGDGQVSVLDVGCGSGHLLGSVARFLRRSSLTGDLVGIDLNPRSVAGAKDRSAAYPEISIVQGDAFRLPFADRSFDYAISSLFFHHLTNEQISTAAAEMSRVARRGFFVIDLHRHPAAYVLYRMFCFAFRISPLVEQDGSLSILRAFRPSELEGEGKVSRVFPFRLVLHSAIPGGTERPQAVE